MTRYQSPTCPDECALELDDAIGRLEAIEPRRASVLEQHYFGGLQLDEIAAALELSLSSVKRDLRLARAWLVAELGDRHDSTTA